MMNNIINQINAAGLKYELEELRIQTERLIKRIEINISVIDIEYTGRLRDIELIDRLNKEIKLITDHIICIDILEESAIQYKDTETMFKCEATKAKLINLMQYIIDKYML